MCFSFFPKTTNNSLFEKKQNKMLLKLIKLFTFSLIKRQTIKKMKFYLKFYFIKWRLYELTWKYIIIFWGIMFSLYFINYLPWIFPKENYFSIDEIIKHCDSRHYKIFDPVILAIINLLVDPFFAFIYFIIYYPKFRNEVNYLSSKKRLTWYFVILFMLGMLDSILYKFIATSWPADTLISKNQQDSIIYFRNFPEAVLVIVLFTGYWSFYKTNQNLFIDKLRLMRRGQSHDLLNLFSYIGLYSGDEENHKLDEFTRRLKEYSSYLGYSRIKDSVPLAEEVKHINNYVNLRIKRLDNPPKVILKGLNLDFNPLVIKQSIVPGLLVEGVRNAIKHGESEDKKWYIKIETNIINDQLIFNVENPIPSNPIIPNSTNEGLNYIKVCLENYYPYQHEFHTRRFNDKFIFDLKIDL